MGVKNIKNSVSRTFDSSYYVSGKYKGFHSVEFNEPTPFSLEAGFVVNNNFGTTGFGVYYARGVINSRVTQWFLYDTNASNVSSLLSGKNIVECYRVTNSYDTVRLLNIPSGAIIESWGAAGNTTTPPDARLGGPGGYATGTVSSVLSQVTLIIGQGGCGIGNTWGDNGYGYGGGGVNAGFGCVRGGGFSAVFLGNINYSNYKTAPGGNPFVGISVSTAQNNLIILAGGGGAAGGNFSGATAGNYGGGGGGTTGGNSGNGGTGGTQTAGGSSNGAAFLGGSSAGSANHGLTCGGGGYYGGGGAPTSGPYNYPGAGGGSGFASTSFLNSITLTQATGNQTLPPATNSARYVTNVGSATTLGNVVPQSSDNYATYSGFHGMISITY